MSGLKLRWGIDDISKPDCLTCVTSQRALNYVFSEKKMEQAKDVKDGFFPFLGHSLTGQKFSFSLKANKYNFIPFHCFFSVTMITEPFESVSL